MLWKTKSIWTLTILSILALVNSSCSKSNSEEVKPNSSESDALLRTVQVEPITQKSLLHTSSYVADLRPSEQVTVLALVTEQILDLPWNDGDLIKKGEVIARIRADSLRRGLDQIRAELDGLSTQIDSQEREVQRTKLLLEGNAATRQALDQLQTAFDTSVARRKGLEANRAQMMLNLEHAVVKAPIGGVVTNLRVQVGDIATPQVPLMVIMKLDTIKVILNVAERDVVNVRPDQEIELRLDAYPGEVFTANISRIMPYLQADTRTNTVEATLNNPVDPQTGLYRLKPGMYGIVNLVMHRREGVLVVPERALLLAEDLLVRQEVGKKLRRVFVLGEDNIVQARTTEIGASSDGFVEVLSGVEEGERIVVRGHHGLKDGQEIKVVDNGELGNVQKPAQQNPQEPGNNH